MNQTQRIMIALLSCFLTLTELSAQTAAENAADADAPPAAPVKPELTEAEKRAQKEKEDRDRILEMDIKTSSMTELAEWCRELKLGEGGDYASLAARLRNHYALPQPNDKTEWDRIITIQSARTTEYFTLETVDEEYARLSGGVKLSLKDGEALHTITAWEILYNRTRNVVSARGGVEHVKEEGGAIETFRGEEILINLDTWAGSFIDSISERGMAGSSTAYRFAGQIITKTDSQTTVLKNAKVSSALSDEPYWSLNASRIWLFPGSDWALFNAVLKVGEIPVFYLPFFAYPADDVVFHPVLGSRTRHGFYMQTTTYILGRPSSDPSKSNSISKILGSSDGMEKVREGIFLRSTGKAETKPNDKLLSLQLDGYMNLGVYGGMILSLPSLGIFKNFKMSSGLAVTRTLFYTNSIYTPFRFTDDEWKSYWDSSYFFGVKIPFRYRLNVETSTSGKFGSLDIKLPLYSDPFINEDVFLYRSEQMDWMNLIKSGINNEPSSSSGSKIGSYQWSLTSKPNISTRIFAPYISTMQINTISTFLTFVPSRDISADSKLDPDTAYIMRYSPERQFFIPDKLSAYAISASIGGTPLSLGSQKTAEKQTPQEPLKEFGEPVSPWKKENEEQEKKNLPSSPYTNRLLPPVLAQTWALPKPAGLQFSVNYNLTPSSATEMQYYTRKFFNAAQATAQDIRWSDFESSVTTFRTDGSTTFSLSEPNNNLFSTSLGFSGTYQWQEHLYISEDRIPTNDIRSMRVSDYRNTQWTTSSSYNLTLTPLYWTNIWRSTNFQYSLAGLVARNTFDYQRYTNDYNDKASSDPNFMPTPEWKMDTMEWTRDYITTHRLTANFSASIRDKVQSLSLTMDLPPLYRLYSASATARTWLLDSSASMQIQEDTDEGKAAGKNSYRYLEGFFFRPLYLTETFHIGASNSARLYAVWDPELDEWTNLSADLSLGKVSMSYAAIRMYKYYYDDTPGSQGWKQEGASFGNAQQLYPRDFTFRWSPSYKFQPFFHNLINMNISSSSSVTIDLQRYTYSRFTFSVNLTLNISKFLDFSMGATSENASIYRYMQKLPFFKDLYDKVGEIGEQNNILIDLLNSFRFDNEELRKQSGFKLKSFSFSAVHHLGDWDASAGVTFTPYLDNTGPPSDWAYKFRTTFSFLVQWLPLTEIETRVDYENEKFFRKTQ